MRLVFPLALVAVAIGLLANQVAGAGTLLDPANLRHEMKLSYCLEQRGTLLQDRKFGGLVHSESGIF